MRTKSTVIIIAAGVVVLGILSGRVSSQQAVDVSALPFSPAREAGDTLYLSGQIAVRPDGSVVDGSIADETRQTMENLRAILEDHGYSLRDVVKVTVYLSDMKHYPEMNAAYRAFFPDGNFPARECVGGLQIAFGLNTEISCIASKGN